MDRAVRSETVLKRGVHCETCRPGRAKEAKEAKESKEAKEALVINLSILVPA